MAKTKLFWCYLIWCACGDAFADEAAATALKQSARAVSPADVLQWLVALLIVLAVIGALVWLLRKSGGFAVNSKRQLAVLTGLSLGMRERLVLVRVGEKQLLLGVTPGKIDKLLELEGDQRLFFNSENDGDSVTFARKLQQLMQGTSHD